MTQKDSRWWAPIRGAIRIFRTLIRVLMFTAVGALLFVVSFFYVANLSDKTLLVLGIPTAVAAVLVLIRVGQHYEWTGFGKSVQPKPEDQEIQPRKTLWDWLQLLIVPLMLALITVVFAWQQNVRQNELEDQRARQAQNIENQRAKAERELAKQRAQDEALQAYLDQMSGLLLEKDLRDSELDSEVRTLARARTLTVLSRLDPSRKAAVMQFLVEAELIQEVEGRESIISLAGADLSDTDLSHIGLAGADTGAGLSYPDLIHISWKGVKLANADLSHARLPHMTDVDLSGANLTGADLHDRALISVDLSGANLSNANLVGADIIASDFVEANLSDANLSSAQLPNSSMALFILTRSENLLDGPEVPSNFGLANLSDANLRDTILFRADLHCTHLNGAHLDNADLGGADLTWAFGVTEEQLAESRVLSNATMPNGQKYKDWRKDEQSQGKDGEDFKNLDRTQLGPQGTLYPCKEPDLEPGPYS